MNVMLPVSRLGLLVGFFVGVLVLWFLEIFNPDQSPGRVAARLLGVSRSR